MAVAQSNSDFGSKYFSQDEVYGLDKLNTEQKAVITTPPSSTKTFSDGHILSNVTFRPYYYSQERNMSDSESVVHIGNIVCEAIKITPVTSSEGTLDYRSISTAELAILMQQKMYEASTSMIESNFYTRGGANGGRGRSYLDPFFNLPSIKKLELLKDKYTQDNETYISHHQHRNTIRNAGQVYGYYLKATELLNVTRSEKEKELLRGVIKQSVYLLTGKLNGATPNLFNQVYILNQQSQLTNN